MVDFVGSSCKHEVNMNISLILDDIKLTAKLSYIKKISRSLSLRRSLCDIYPCKDITGGLPDFISS